jgi:hypothetical protein
MLPRSLLAAMGLVTVTRRTLSLLLIACVSLGTLAFGLVPSGAWFIDSWTSAGFIITSGSLDLHVSGGPLTATNLEPGQGYAPLGEFCSANTGTLDLKYRGLFESTAPIANNLLQYVTMKVEQHTTGPWVTLQEIPGVAMVETDSLVSYFKHPQQGAEVVNHFVVAGSLVPDERICYRLSVLLDPNTPDSEQGQAVDFILHLDATQATNPTWQ